MSNDGDQLEEWVSRAADPTLGKVCQYQWEERPLGIEHDPLLHGPCGRLPVKRVTESVMGLPGRGGWTQSFADKHTELCREHLAIWEAKRTFKPLEPQSIAPMLDGLSYDTIEDATGKVKSLALFSRTRAEQIKSLAGKDEP